MREEKLMDAMEYVDDQLLESAADSMRGKRKRLHWKPVATMAACLAMVVGLFWYNRFPPVPKYENAIFSAEQIGELFPAKDAMGTNAYTEEGYPNEELFAVPEVLDVEYLNVYQRTDAKPSESALRSFMTEILPHIEKMYDIEIPSGYGIAQSKYGDGYYSGRMEIGGKEIWGENAFQGLCISWCNKDYQSPLVIDGKTLYATSIQTDEEIMQSVSAVIPYLEQAFDLKLSTYKIQRYRSSYDNDLYGLCVWLYDDGRVIDKTLAQYDDTPPRYCTGDMICLEFDRVEVNPSETVVCKYIRYYRSVQYYQSYAQCRMLSLDEAEYLLEQGCVFSAHSCPLCMAQQAEVDFSDYDHVGLEYVFDDYGVPFYTFYKKIREDEDGFVRYAKTMVPAIEVSGLEEYFEEQQRYHISW